MLFGMAYRIGRGVVLAVGLLLAGCQASVQGEAHAAAGDGADEQTQGGDAEQAVAPGALPTSLSCNHGRIRLGEGTYAGNLVVGGNHCLVEGAGRGKTIIEGSLSLSGNHNKVRGRVQLNVRDALENGRLQRIAVNPDGTPWNYRIIDPRQFILTTTFDL